MNFQNRLLKLFFGFISMTFTINLNSQLVEVTNFGNNFGNLKMYQFIPSNPQLNAPLVVVMHGCMQNATTFANETGWNTLAEQYGFYVLYPEQKSINNGYSCLNWMSDYDNQRGIGEAKTIYEMIEYMQDNYALDTSRTYITGLSAGGAMTAVMMATYPEKFKKGGINAGYPYDYDVYFGLTDNYSPTQWAQQVLDAYPNYNGEYPTLAICQGLNDIVVAPINEKRLISQWTKVHQTDTIADITNASFNGNNSVYQAIYMDSLFSDTIVMSYTITGLPHGISVDTGLGSKKGGQLGTYSFDYDFFSTYWLADFFNLIPQITSTTKLNPISVKNDIQIIQNINNITLLNPNSEILEIDLFSMHGQLLYSNTSSELNIDLSWWNSQLFILRLKYKHQEILLKKISKY